MIPHYLKRYLYAPKARVEFLGLADRPHPDLAEARQRRALNDPGRAAASATEWDWRGFGHSGE